MGLELPGRGAGLMAVRAVPQAQTASPLQWVHHRDPRSPTSATSLLQANVVCVVYDVTKEATIEKVMGPPLER